MNETAKNDTLSIETTSTEVLTEIAERIRCVVAARKWSVGDKCYWKDLRGNVNQGTVKALLSTGYLGVAKKGELQWGNVVDPLEAKQTFEAACK